MLYKWPGVYLYLMITVLCIEGVMMLNATFNNISVITCIEIYKDD